MFLIYSFENVNDVHVSLSCFDLAKEILSDLVRLGNSSLCGSPGIWCLICSLTDLNWVSHPYHPYAPNKIQT
jgi:hypothetical protein